MEGNVATIDLRSGKKSLSDLAYEEILNSIFSHEFMPGASLRSKELATRFGISPTPIERALERLAGEGLVEFVPGLGPRVSTPNLKEILDLYEAREMIELFAVENGIQNADDEFLNRLENLIQMHEKCFEEMETNPEGQLTAASIDTDIHQFLITLWPNSTVQSWYRRLHVHTKSYQIVYIPGYRRKDSLDEHNKILLALKAHDLSAALAAVRVHNENARASFLARLEIAGSVKGEKQAEIISVG
jgi:DNA-binding GntR family transcriptional regulator